LFAKEVYVPPDVERQLSDLYADIADDSGEARADTFVGGIVDDCLSLVTFPRRGSTREDIRSSEYSG